MRHVQHDMSCRAQRRELIVQLDGVRQQLVAADFFPAGSPDVELLTEMAVFGDAGCFLDQARLRERRGYSLSFVQMLALAVGLQLSLSGLLCMW